MNRKRKYQDGGSKETPDSTGQGGAPPQVQNPLIQSNRADQKRVNDQIMMRTISSQNQALHITNAMSEIEAERKLVQQQQFQQQMMVMQTRMQMLQQQNDLLKTKIEKDDLINSARTIPSNNQKAMNSPKKRGGSTKFSMGGTKRKGKVIIQESGMNGMMRHGGSCLPGGRYSKKRR